MLALFASESAPAEVTHLMLTSAIFKWPGFLSTAFVSWAAPKPAARIHADKQRRSLIVSLKILHARRSIGRTLGRRERPAAGHARPRKKADHAERARARAG